MNDWMKQTGTLACCKEKLASAPIKPNSPNDPLSL